MIPKEYRLKKKSDIAIVFEQGRFVNGGVVGAKVWKIDPQAYPKRGYTVDELKMGFAVGKKVSKSAVRRNRIKRQMREVVRLLLKEKELAGGVYILFIAHASIVDASYDDIKTSIFSILKKIRCI